MALEYLPFNSEIECCSAVLYAVLKIEHSQEQEC